MANNIFSRIFGFPKKRDENQGPPIPKEPSQTILDLKKRILDAQEGFGPEFVQRTTSPFTRELEARFPRAKEELLETFGGMGLGRSTIAGREVGELQRQRDIDINKLIAEASLQDLLQQKSDVARKEQGLFNIGNVETGQANLALQDEQQRALKNIGFGQTRDLAETEALNRAIGVPLAIGSSVATGNPAFALGSLGVGSDLTNFTSADIAQVLRQRGVSGIASPSPFSRAPQTRGGFLGLGGTQVNPPTKRQLDRLIRGG